VPIHRHLQKKFLDIINRIKDKTAKMEFKVEKNINNRGSIYKKRGAKYDN